MLDKSKLILCASLLVAVGSWGAHFNSWIEIFQPSTLFGLIGTVGGVVLAWLGDSPIKRA
mgnify:CR=1 FL=1